MLRRDDGADVELLRFSTYEPFRRFRHHFLDPRICGHLCEDIPERTLWSFQCGNDILYLDGCCANHQTTITVQWGGRIVVLVVVSSKASYGPLPEQYRGPPRLFAQRI